MRAYVTIEKGLGKSMSEDRALLGDLICAGGDQWYGFASDHILIALADGVGGNAGGGDAAQFILEQFCIMFNGKAVLSEAQVKDDILAVNQKLIDTAASIPGKPNMATTLTGLWCNAETAYCFHVGNTRLYTIQGSYLRQITTDHTTKEWLLRTGQVEAAQHCNASEITACLGGGNLALATTMQIIPINNWKSMLGWVLTSDGIHEYVDDDEIDLLSCDSAQIPDACYHVMQDAVDNGSTDDRSIIVVRKGD